MEDPPQPRQPWHMVVKISKKFPQWAAFTAQFLTVILPYLSPLLVHNSHILGLFELTEDRRAPSWGMFCVEGLASSYGPPVHRTLQYTIQCVLYSVYYTLCTIQYTVCTIMCVLYSVFYSVCTIQFVPYSAMCSTPCSVFYTSTQCSVELAQLKSHKKV